MSQLKIFLFGKFHIKRDEQSIDGLENIKIQEMLCQILLHRERPLSRETLAGTLWGEVPTSHSRKYLRQILWRMRTLLSFTDTDTEPPLLLVDSEWVKFNPEAPVWIDLVEFERVYQHSMQASGHTMEAQSAQELKNAVRLYRGDFLEGCYQDWCLFERERCQNIFLSILDMLMDYGEAHVEYKEALDYGNQILRLDRARERTHRQMIRIYLLAGERTEALRQYERCVAALSEELAVAPSRNTVALLEQALADGSGRTQGEQTPSLGEVFNSLHRLRGALSKVQQQILDEIQSVENYLQGGGSGNTF